MGSGIEVAKALTTSIRVGPPYYPEEIKLLIDAGEHIVVELPIEGTHTDPMNDLQPTRRVVAFRDMTILKLQDDTIIEQRGLSDYLTIFQRLGVLPEIG